MLERMALGVLLAGMACTPHRHWESVRADLRRLEPAPAGIDARAAARGLFDLRGAVHVHGHLSPDSDGQPDEILEAAQQAGLDFLVMTDHATPAIFEEGLRGRYGEVLVIRGMEINWDCVGFADRCPSLLAVGLETYVEVRGRTAPEVVEAIREQGGLAFVAHPRGWRDWSLPGLAGLEIYDVLDDALDHKLRFPRFWLDVWHSYDAYPEEVFLSFQDRPAWHLETWDRLLQSRRWVGIAGNDAHRNIRWWNRQVDPYELSFRFVTTHVWAEALDEPAVMAALAAGRAYVAFDLLADARGFWFEAIAGEEGAISGDDRPLSRGWWLHIASPRVARLTLLRDGKPWAQCDCDEIRVHVTQPGSYRVEGFVRVGGRWRPWILSNPIRLH